LATARFFGAGFFVTRVAAGAAFGAGFFFGAGFLVTFAAAGAALAAGFVFAAGFFFAAAFFAVAIEILRGNGGAIGPTAGIRTVVTVTVVRGGSARRRNLPRLPESRVLPPGEPANAAAAAQPVNSGAGGGR